MKKLILIALIVLTSNYLFSQENKAAETKYTYAVIIGTQSYLNDDFKVELDFGINFTSKDRKESKFKSLIDALNFVSAYNWSLDKTYVNTYEKMNKSIHYWVIKKSTFKDHDTEKKEILTKFYE